MLLRCLWRRNDYVLTFPPDKHRLLRRQHLSTGADLGCRSKDIGVPHFRLRRCRRRTYGAAVRGAEASRFAQGFRVVGAQIRAKGNSAMSLPAEGIRMLHPPVAARQGPRVDAILRVTSRKVDVAAQVAERLLLLRQR